MKKWLVNVRESQIIEGERTYTTSSHIVEAVTAFEARISFASRCFPNEKIQDVVEYVAKEVKPVKH